MRELQEEFVAIHRRLRLGGAARAAQAILTLLGRHPATAGTDARATRL
jgi:hypothetical protein